MKKRKAKRPREWWCNPQEENWTEITLVGFNSEKKARSVYPNCKEIVHVREVTDIGRPTKVLEVLAPTKGKRKGKA